nr:reverse transcriptase domain-containing protein [Tanacetum cinerariifolium]
MVRLNGQAPRSMKELCQLSINGRGGPIAPIPIQATDFGLRHHMIQQVQNTCQFHGLPGDDANRHIDKFLEITQHMKQNGVSDDALRLSLFPYSLTHHAIACHRDTINATAGGTFMQKTPEECYELIKNMTAHHNHWDTSAIRDETSRNISSTSESPKVVRQLEMMNKNFLKMMRQIQMVKIVDTKCKTCGGPHSFTECLAAGGYTQETAYATAVVERVPEVTKDTVQPRTENIQPLVAQTQVPIDKPVVAPNPKPAITYPSRVTKQKLHEKDDNLALKFVEIFRNLHFNLSFVDALLHMPKFALMFKSLLNNKEKLFDLATTLVNENRSDRGLSYKQIDSTEIDDTDFDLEGDIHLLEELLNNDPSSSPLPPKELNMEDIKTIKSSIDEPPELELKDLPSHLEYVFLEGIDKLTVIIYKELKDEEKSTLLKVLESHKRSITWKIFDIKGIDPHFCTHKILMKDDLKPTVQHQRRVNLKIHEVIKKEVIKLLDAGLIYPISNSPWVSPVHCVPKKGGMTVVEIEDNELIPTRLVMGWRVCIDYRKFNDATRKDHFSLPFMDQMLEHLARNEFYFFLDGFSGYFQIPIDPQDQGKTTFTCPYGTFAYRRISFGLCNALGMFQRCMMAIFYDMIEETMKVFMDDFLIFGAKNLAADHLSRLENSHQDELEKKEITEAFPFETPDMIAFRGDSSTSWFSDIANYHAGNFIMKGTSF